MCMDVDVDVSAACAFTLLYLCFAVVAADMSVTIRRRNQCERRINGAYIITSHAHACEYMPIAN